MYLQEILEVVVGLVFMWLVLSIAVMQLLEWLATALEWRSASLESAIRQMLVDGKLTKKFYQHPIITGLFSARPGKKPRPPAFIPADKFALALFDIAINAGTEASPVQAFFDTLNAELEKLEDPAQKKLAKEDWEAIAKTAKQVAASQIGETAIDSVKARIQEYGERHQELNLDTNLVLDQIDKYYQNLLDEQRRMAPAGQEKDPTLRQIRLGVLALDAIYPKSQAKKSIGTLLTGVEEYVKQGEQALAAARTNVEAWFNDAMDRLQGVYKRKAQLASFLIGLGLALILNVDSINVATSMWREPTLRQAIVAQAESYVQQNPEGQTAENEQATSPLAGVENLQNELKALNLPFGWFGDPLPTQSGVPCDPFKPSVYDEAGNPTRIMGISMRKVCYPLVNAPTLNIDNWLAWLTKILGLMLSGAAAAQGAPFWFDILKKLINVRSSGPNPNEKK